MRCSILLGAEEYMGSRSSVLKNIAQVNAPMGSRGREQIYATGMSTLLPGHWHSMGTFLISSSTLRNSLGNINLIALFMKANHEYKQNIE